MRQKLTGLAALALCAVLLLAACGRTAVEEENSAGASSSGLTAEEQGGASGTEQDGTQQSEAQQDETEQTGAQQSETEQSGAEGDGSKQGNSAGGGAADPERQEWTPEVTVSETVKTERSDESDGTTLLSFSYNTVTVTIPGNEAAAEAIQAELDARLAELQETANELVEERAADEYFDLEYYLSGTYTLTRADSGVISLRYEVTQYLGGAHQSCEISGVSFDTATGERLTLAALGEGVQEAAVETCQLLTQKVADANEDFFFDGYLEGVESSVVTDNTFWLTADGIAFIDNEYVLQAYALGTLEYLVPYSAVSDVLEEAYFRSGTEGTGASVALSDGTSYTLES